MDTDKLQVALEDIDVIKSVLDRTAQSLIGNGRVFFVWGVILLLERIGFMLLLHYEYQHNVLLGAGFQPHFWVNQLRPWIIYIAPIFLILSYFWFSRRSVLYGINRELMAVWLWALLLLQLGKYFILSIYHSAFFDGKISVYWKFEFIWPAIILSLAFMCTGALTRFAFPKWIAVIMPIMVIALIIRNIPFTFPLVPCSLLLLAGYLEWKRYNRGKHGNK